MDDNRWYTDSSGTFSCKECSCKFASEAAVTSHLRIAHPAGQTLHCSQCPMTFKDNWHLKRHLFTHGMTDPDMPPPKNMCSICNATYPDSWHLSKHMKQHENGEIRAPWRWKKRGRPPNALRLSTLPHKPAEEWTAESTPVRPMSTAEEFIENYRRTSGLKPEAMEFYCGICGEGVAKTKFSTHSLGHFHDVFEVRRVTGPGDEGGVPIQMLGPTGECGECQNVLRKVRKIKDVMMEDYCDQGQT